MLLCVQEEVGSWVSAVGSYPKYDILYYGIVLGVGISIVVLIHTQSLSNIWRGKMAGKKKIQISCVCCAL